MGTLLTKRAAAALVGYHPEHVMRLSRDPKSGFPRAIKMGDSENSAVRFDEDELALYIEDRKAARS
jgi:predicted DNA-binding transcriptional regulator AlpA